MTSPVSPAESPWLSMAEAARYLKYTSKHAPIVVRAMIVRERIPVYRKNQKSLLVLREDLDEFVLTGNCVNGRRRYQEMRRHPVPLPDTPTPTIPKPKRGRGRPRKVQQAEA